MTVERSAVHVVVTDGFAGVERYVADVANELGRRGWRTSVVGGDADRMLHELSGDVGWRPGAGMVQSFRSLSQLGPVDLVHVHMTAAEVVGAALTRRNAGRLVTTRHFAASRGKTTLGRIARPLIARAVDGQVSISRFVADHVDGTSTVIHNGVQSSTGDAAPREQFVLVLQRLEAEKDTATALRAWQLSELRTQGWRLVICGRGAEEASLRQLAGDLQIEASVQFRGFVAAPREVLSHAGFMLATAPAEPFGLSVVEAMAEGTPVIAAEGGAHPETLGPDGRFFPAGDAVACATALDDLGRSDSDRQLAGAALRVRHAQLFTVERHVDQLVGWYEAICRLETS